MSTEDFVDEPKYACVNSRIISARITQVGERERFHLQEQQY